MKKKMLRAFTLVEIIIVVAIFSLIMFGAMMLLNPVRALFDKTYEFEDARAAMDNITRGVESTLRNANRVHIYAGFDSYADINSNNMRYYVGPEATDYASDWTISPTSELYEVNFGLPKINALDKSGNVTTQFSTPVDYLRQRFYLVPNLKLSYEWGNNPTTDIGKSKVFPQYDSDGFTPNAIYAAANTDANNEWEIVPSDATKKQLRVLNKFERIIEISRQSVDKTLETQLTYVLAIEKNTDGTLKSVKLGTSTNGGTVTFADYINPIYFANYDYQLVFGEPTRDAGNTVLVDDDPATDIYEYDRWFDDGVTSGYIDHTQKYFDTKNFVLTLTAKPKDTPRKTTTFKDARLFMTAAFGLENSIQNAAMSTVNLGNPMKERLFFNIMSAPTLTHEYVYYKDLTTIDKVSAAQFYTLVPNDTNYDPWPNFSAALKFSDIDPAALGIEAPYNVGFSYTNYPMWNNQVGDKLKPMNTAKIYLAEIAPQTDKYEIFFKGAHTEAEKASAQLNFANANGNVYIVFTMPKDFHM